MTKNTTCIVMRKACLQEDEGRESYVASFDDRAKAQAWVDQQKGEYFGPGDYKIVGPS